MTRDCRETGLPRRGIAGTQGCQGAPMSPQGEEAKPQTEIIYIQAL